MPILSNPPQQPFDGLAYLRRALKESHGTLNRMKENDEKLVQARAELHRRPEAAQTTRRLQTEMAIRELTAIGMQRRKERSESACDSGIEMTGTGDGEGKENQKGEAVREDGGGKELENAA